MYFAVSDGFPFYKLSADDALKVIAQNLLLLPVRQVAHQHTADHNSGIVEGLIGAKDKLLKRRTFDQLRQICE